MKSISTKNEKYLGINKIILKTPKVNYLIWEMKFFTNLECLCDDLKVKSPKNQ
jgi:hypothetical protein